jgi:hypothetical protein
MEKSLKELWESRTDGRCHNRTLSNKKVITDQLVLYLL